MSRTKPRITPKTEKSKNSTKLYDSIHNIKDPDHVKNCHSCKSRSFYDKAMNTTKVVDVLPEAFEEAVTEIKSYHPKMVGVDTKTQLDSSRISIITICVPDTMTYIFKVQEMYKTYEELPPSLISLLQTPHIVKIMFDPVSRAEQLKDYNIRFDGVIDVRSIACIRGHTKTGVDSLAKELFPGYHHHDHWRRRKFFVQSKWGEKLSTEMIDYTVSRANLAVISYHALCLQPVTPFTPVKMVE